MRRRRAICPDLFVREQIYVATDLTMDDPMDHEPEQVFYKIGELSEMLGVESSVLRFWEKEFSQIRPMKVGPRKRLYRHRDLELFQEIKHLLYQERFTIAGAKKRLDREDFRQGRLFDDDDKVEALPLFEAGKSSDEKLLDARRVISETRRDLMQIRDMLAAGSRRPARKAKTTAAKPKSPRRKKPSQTQDLLDDPKD